MSVRLTVLLGGVFLASGCGSGEPAKSAEQTKTSDQGVSAPPNLPATFVRPAVDHVVTYSWWRGFGPKGGDRITMWRHANLFREERELIGSKRPSDPAVEAHYSNIATGASFKGSLRRSGESGGVTIWRGGNQTSGRYRLVRSGEAQTIAGERCTVWRAEPIGERGVPRRGCIADDGVVLYDSWLYKDGKVAEERTAVKVDRRTVAPAEVLPPKEALNWAGWLSLAEGVEPKPTGKPENYDLRLKRTGSNEPDSAELRYRASGGWNSMESWMRGELERFHTRHSSGAVRLSQEKSSLSMLSGPGAKSAATIKRVEPLDRDPTAVVGERCSWFDTTVGVSDYWRHECRTADGLPLIIEEGGRGGARTPYVAVSLSRGKTRLREVMPPAGLLSWAQWGWPELGR